MSRDNKRFIKQVIPMKAWRKLDLRLREAWNYMWINCDESGIYIVDEDLFEFNNGYDFPKTEMENTLSEWLLFNEDKILIKSFIETNYGSEPNPNYNPHKPLFRCLKKNNLRLNSSLNQAYFKLVEEDIDEEEDEEEDEGVDVKNKKECDINFEEVIEIFNSVCTNLPEVQKLTLKRKGLIRARAKDFSLEKIGEVFRLVSCNEFLNGGNDKGWRADFDWVMNPNNFLKILEKNYSNDKKTSKNQTGASQSYRNIVAKRLGVIQP